MFAARVGAFDFSQFRSGIVFVQAVEEHDPGLAVPPGLVNDLLKYFPGVELAGDLAVPGVNQFIVLSRFNRLHELLGDAHGNIEVGEFFGIRLACYEFGYIRMIHPQYPHVGTPSHPALLYRFGGGVEHLHERYRARCHSTGGAHNIVFRPQPGKAEPGAAA